MPSSFRLLPFRPRGGDGGDGVWRGVSLAYSGSEANIWGWATHEWSERSKHMQLGVLVRPRSALLCCDQLPARPFPHSRQAQSSRCTQWGVHALTVRQGNRILLIVQYHLREQACVGSSPLNLLLLSLRLFLSISLYLSVFYHGCPTANGSDVGEVRLRFFHCNGGRLLLHPTLLSLPRRREGFHLAGERVNYNLRVIFEYGFISVTL